MGTGRAILIMRQNPRMDFTREIVELATRNPAYDPQLEDSRAPYVLSLIKERRLEDEIVRILCEAIPNVDLDDWDGVHQLELAWLLVREGYACLKETIYGRYTQTTCEHDFYALEEGIIEHDGLEGLLAVAERNGQVLSQNAGFTPDFWTYDKAVQEFLGKLELAGKDKPSIKLFLSAYFRFKELGGRDSSLARELQEDAYELVRECVEQKKVARVPVRWIRRLSDDQVLKLAYEFLETRDKKRLCLYLAIFSRRKFPLGTECLLRLLNRPIRRTLFNERLLDALALCSAPEVRSLALEILGDRRIDPTHWDLLRFNYQDGDGCLLSAKIKSCRSQHKIHGAAISCIQIYEEQTTQDCREPLLALYDRCPCSFCRGNIVDLLRAAGVCPSEIEEEFPYDTCSHRDGYR